MAGVALAFFLPAASTWWWPRSARPGQHPLDGGAATQLCPALLRAGCPDNPATRDKLALGQRSVRGQATVVTGTVSCSSCHDPSAMHGRRGHRPRRIRPPARTPHAIALQGRLGPVPDVGRARLEPEDQIRLPLTHRDAMGATCQHAVERLSADDDMGAFAGTFRGSPGMTSETIAKALAVFECSLPSAPTRFDRWIAGEASALSQSEQNGFAIFTGRCRKRRLASASPSPASTRRSAASIPACAQASRCSDRGACADCWMGRGTFITQLCLAAG